MNQPDDHNDTDSTDLEELVACYRTLAREQTPPHLDDAVLRLARRAARRSPSRSPRWLRPLALAVTICLSFALLMEITDSLPGRRAAQEPLPASPLDRPERAPKALKPKSSADEFRNQDLSNLRKADDLARRQGGFNRDPAASVSQFRTQPSASGAINRDADTSNACRGAVRDQPQTWLTCIKALERDNAVDAARRERAELERTFPGFDTN